MLLQNSHYGPPPQHLPFPRHNTYMSLAFEQLHWLLWVSSTECKGTESVGRFVFKPSQQLVQACATQKGSRRYCLSLGVQHTHLETDRGSILHSGRQGRERTAGGDKAQEQGCSRPSPFYD